MKVGDDIWLDKLYSSKADALEHLLACEREDRRASDSRRNSFAKKRTMWSQYNQ